MDMTLPDIVKDYVGHQWLALALLLALYFRRLLGPDSKLPITLSQAWRSVFVGVFLAISAGLVLRQNGVSWGSSVLAMFVTAGAGGVGDNLLAAVWGNSSSAPPWSKVIAFLWKDLSPAASGSASGGGPMPAAKLGSKAPPALRRCVGGIKGRSGLLVGLFALALVACSAIYPMLGKVEQLVLDDLNAKKTDTQIETDVATLLDGKVGADVVAIVNDAVTLLIDGGWVPSNLLADAQALKGKELGKMAARQVMAVPTSRWIPTHRDPLGRPFLPASMVDAGAGQ